MQTIIFLIELFDFTRKETSSSLAKRGGEGRTVLLIELVDYVKWKQMG